MHNHNNNSSSMMWLMALCCLGPVVIAFLAGGAKGGLSIWLIFGALAICVIAHFAMHRKHNSADQPSDKNENKPEDDSPKL